MRLDLDHLGSRQRTRGVSYLWFVGCTGAGVLVTLTRLDLRYVDVA